MKQEIIKKAQNKILEKRLKAEENYQNSMQSLYKDESFIKLEKEHTRLLIANAQKESQNEKADKKQEETLKNQINDFKKRYNVLAEPEYECKLCHDEGYKNGQMCTCLKREISNILLKESGFENLHSFNDNKDTDLAPMFKLMKDWCNKKSDKNLIYIDGPTGVGKTYLLQCMANELINNGKIVKIVTAFAMNQDFKTFQKTGEEDYLQKYLDCEVLFIDDLGTEPNYKNVTVENLYIVINERKMRKLPTIITTNLTLEDIRNRYDERIFSRIIDRQTSITVSIKGDDKRKK
ncbi:MAG: ATP-binding protein [Clostridia bacterium]|nr:ATP-binding protein [Clostridia bacterium]